MWFVIYFIVSGLILTLLLNILVNYIEYFQERFEITFEDLEDDLRPLGLTLHTMRYILPQLSLMCLLFGWVLLPIAIIQEILGKLGIKL